ncbi:MAG: dihydrofolate reductase family protein [Enterococcus sp.]
MRKLIFYGAISLDGYLATQNDNLQWLFDTDLAGTSTYDTFITTVDTVVMGRKTFEEAQKLMPDQVLYPDKTVIVFSRTPHQAVAHESWCQEEVVSYLTNLKKQKGADIWFVGGGNLLKPVLEADLIDEWYVQVAPVLLGRGKSLFEPGDYNQRLEMLAVVQMGELTELHLAKKKEN